MGTNSTLQFPDPGLTEPGNIDMNTRPRVKNADGSTSTVRSMGTNIDGQEVLLPTVSDDGRIMTPQEAIQQYLSTGKHLGKFNSVDASNAFAQKLHESEAKKLMGQDTTGNMQAPDAAAMAQARGMSPNQIPNAGGLPFGAKPMPTRGVLQSGKNQNAPGMPGTSLAGPMDPNMQGSGVYTPPSPAGGPAGQLNLQQRIAQAMSGLGKKIGQGRRSY